MSRFTIPLKLRVSRFMVVEKGDLLTMAVDNFGYSRVPAREDGIYLGPDYGIVTYQEMKHVVKDLKRLRKRRQQELQVEIEKNVAAAFNGQLSGDDS